MHGPIYKFVDFLKAKTSKFVQSLWAGPFKKFMLSRFGNLKVHFNDFLNNPGGGFNKPNFRLGVPWHLCSAIFAHFVVFNVKKSMSILEPKIMSILWNPLLFENEF